MRTNYHEIWSDFVFLTRLFYFDTQNWCLVTVLYSIVVHCCLMKLNGSASDCFRLLQSASRCTWYIRAVVIIITIIVIISNALFSKPNNSHLIIFIKYTWKICCCCFFPIFGLVHLIHVDSFSAFFLNSSSSRISCRFCILALCSLVRGVCVCVCTYNTAKSNEFNAVAHINLIKTPIRFDLICWKEKKIKLKRN